MVFEKITGGQLLDRISTRKYFTEEETVHIVRDIAAALEFLHSKGIAHRDLKPENILCVYPDSLTPVKLCDFDLGSGIKFHSGTGELSSLFYFFRTLLVFLLVNIYRDWLGYHAPSPHPCGQRRVYGS